MSEFENKLKLHLETLADAARIFYEDSKRYGIGGTSEENFEVELVRAEDFLEGVVGDAEM